MAETSGVVARSDGFYWATILAACIMGETVADFLSHGPMGLGYGVASLILGAGVVLALVAERTAHASNETRYWTTVVIMATAGTTIADFLSRTLELGYLKGTTLLAGLFAVTFVVWRRRPDPLPDDSLLPHVDISHERTSGHPGVLPHADLARHGQRLPPTDGRYWAAIMVASTLGTTAGDALTNGTDLGFGGAAALLSGVLIVVLFIESRAKAANEARYWTALVLCSTIGAATGDFITHEDGLDWGYYWGSLFVIGLFVTVALIGALRKALQSARAHLTKLEHDFTNLTASFTHIAHHLETTHAAATQAAATQANWAHSGPQPVAAPPPPSRPQAPPPRRNGPPPPPGRDRFAPPPAPAAPVKPRPAPATRAPATRPVTPPRPVAGPGRGPAPQQPPHPW